MLDMVFCLGMECGTDKEWASLSDTELELLSGKGCDWGMEF